MIHNPFSLKKMEYQAQQGMVVYRSRHHATLLTASVHEEMGKEISPNDLKEIIHGYQEGDLNGNQEGIYDAAVYCCGVLARKCFADDPDDEDAEVDYEVSWIENQDGSMSGEVRPT